MCQIKIFIFCYISLIIPNIFLINAENEIDIFAQQQMEEAYYKYFLDFYTLQSNVIKSEQCKIDCEIYRKAFNNKEMWAIGMFDSSSKMQSGFLSGNLADYGDFNQCINIEVNVENGTTIRGKHVLISIAGYVIFSPFPFQAQRGIPMLQLPYLNYLNQTLYNIKLYRPPPEAPRKRQSFRAFPSHRWAICVPDSCNREEIVEHLGLYMHRNNITRIYEAIENTLDSQWRIRDYDCIVIFIFLVIGVLLIVQTIYDTYLHYTQTKTKHWTFTAFSILSNGRRLVTTSNRPELLPCLDGIRVIGMTWIIFAHEVDSTILSFNYNSVESFGVFTKILYQFINANQVQLHQFFMLGGFLTMYGFLRTREKEPTFNIIKFYARRYLRLTPLVAAAILCQISFLRLISNGPLFQTLTLNMENTCKSNWWQALLYVSNYVDPYNICLPQSWYLCADTQLYWLSPLLLLPVVWWKKCAYYLFGIVLVVGTGILWYVVYENRLNPNGEPSDYFSLYHVATHCRIVPWIVGHALAYFIYQNRNRKFNIPMWLATLLWITTFALLGYSMLGMYPTNRPDYEYDRAYLSYFMTMSHVFFSVGASWIIFACLFGYGGIVNWFLSLPMWQPLSRLTYAMYITHYTLQLALHAGVKTPMWFSKMHLFYNCCGLYGATLVVALIWTLSFEMPFMVVDAQLCRKSVTKSVPENEMTIRNLTIQKK